MAPAVKSVKLGRFVTAAGSSLFGSGNTPSPYDDTKVEGTVVIDQEGKDAFQAWLDAKLTPEVLKEVGLKKDQIASIFKEDTDKDDNPTGLWRVKGKSKIAFMPKFVDGNGQEFKPAAGFKIPNRATVQLSLGVEIMKMSTFSGLVLRLQGTKILEVPDYGTGFEDDNSATGGYSYAEEAPAEDVEKDEIPW